MRQIIKTLLLLLVLLFCTGANAEDYYVNEVPGVPVAPGKRLGGLWRKEEPKCSHDLSTIESLKAENRKAAKNWRTIAFWSSILSGIALLVWYLTKVSEVGGVAVISLLWSLFSTFMATVVTITWLVVLIVCGLGLIGLGIYLHKKSFFSWLKEKKNV